MCFRYRRTSHVFRFRKFTRHKIRLFQLRNKCLHDLGFASNSGRELNIVAEEICDRQSDYIVAKENAASSFVAAVPIECLPSSATRRAWLGIKIIPTTVPYSKTKIRFSLQIERSEDINTQDLIQHYEFPIQVCNEYRHNPEANVLLITNCETSKVEVDNWKLLLCTRLGMEMDIFNVSIYGSLTTASPNGGPSQNLFHLYRRKIVIILGNQFEYFDNGHRTAIDLIDQTDFVDAALDGTSLIVTCTKFEGDMRLQIQRLLFSRYSRTRSFMTVKELIMAIQKAQYEQGFLDTKFIVTPLLKHYDPMTRCTTKATHAAVELQKYFPNLRFTISWLPSSSTNLRIAGNIQVLPSVPYKAKLLITGGDMDSCLHSNEFCILLSLPFSTRLKMLWEVFARQRSGQVNQLSAVVKLDLALELARFIGTNPEWPDSIPRRDIILQLTRLDEFLRYDVGCQVSIASVTDSTKILADLAFLVECCQGSWRCSWGQDEHYDQYRGC